MSGRRSQRRPADPRTGRLYRIVAGSRHLSTPPPILRKAKLDNLALVPGSVLPFKEQWQQLANELPAGTTLIILPPHDGPQRRTLQRVAEQMKANGSQVAILPTDKIGDLRHSSECTG